MKDVGTGGFEGFGYSPEIIDCHYHSGGHSAALKEAPLSVLAAQVAGATELLQCRDLTPPVLTQAVPRWFERLSAISFLLPWVVLILIGLMAWAVAPILAAHFHFHWSVLESRILLAGVLLMLTAAILKFV